MTSTIWPSCATTAKICSAELVGDGSTKVHVVPPSSDRARPQFVPTNTVCGLPAFIEICHADGSFFAVPMAQFNLFSVKKLTGVHVTPASLLMLMPDCGLTRPSKNDVAYTRWLFRGSTLTSHVEDGENVLILTHVLPWSRLWYRPPHSVAA